MRDGDYVVGARAKVGGHEYTALPSEKGRDYVRLALGRGHGPEPGFEWSNRDLLYVRDVPLEEVEEYYHSRWEFRWRGKWFVLDKIEHGFLYGTLSGGSDAWARENGLTVIDRAWAVGTFSPDEVENLHEERTDFLAEWKERRRR